MSLTGHELADYLFKRYPPDTEKASLILDGYMDMFRQMAFHITSTTPVTPEQTIALRALWDAHRAAIFALVGHQ
jgi:hypothetical protein